MFTTAQLATMPIAERVYFGDEHAAHVVTRDEHRRLERIQQDNRRALRAIERRGYRYEGPAHSLACQ